MKVLFICNTPFQVITALNIWRTRYQKDDCHMVFSDCFNGYERLADRLRKRQILGGIETVKIKDLLRRSKKNIIETIFNRKGLLGEFLQLEQYDYDQMLFYNFDLFSCCVYNKIEQINPAVRTYRFEEGFSTYFNNLDQMISCAFFERSEKIRRFKYLSANVDGYWYYHTDLARYKHRKEDRLIDIPLLRRDDQYLKEILNDIFDVSGLQNGYNKKNIFFEGSSYYDKDEINDIEIVSWIAGYLGKDEIEIKLHPRSTIDRFSKLGMRTTDKSEIPWEMIQLNRSFDGYCFFTVSSGSVLASKLYFSDDVTIIFLYKCTNRRPKPATEEFDRYLEKVREKFGGYDIFIPESMEELQTVLKEKIMKCSTYSEQGS